MAMIEAHVDVQAPLDLVYEQWTRVEVEMDYDTEAWTDSVARLLNLVDMQVKDDLLRFKDLVERG